MLKRKLLTGSPKSIAVNIMEAHSDAMKTEKGCKEVYELVKNKLMEGQEPVDVKRTRLSATFNTLTKGDMEAGAKKELAEIKAHDREMARSSWKLPVEESGVSGPCMPCQAQCSIS